MMAVKDLIIDCLSGFDNAGGNSYRHLYLLSSLAAISDVSRKPSFNRFNIVKETVRPILRI